MQFKQSVLVRRINDLAVDKGMFAATLKNLESMAESQDEEFDDVYYEVLELHDMCGEMIELYRGYLKTLINE